MKTFPGFQLFAVSILAHIALAGSRVTTALYALSLHGSEFSLGILIALFAFVPMLAAVHMGRLIDRIGITIPMMAGCLAIAVACVLAAGASSLASLFFIVPLIGTGFMAVHIGSQHMVGATSTPANRSSNFSRLSMCFSFSGFIGPVMAGFVIDHASFSIAYLACAGSALAALALTVTGKRKHFQLPVQAVHTVPGSILELVRAPGMRPIYFVSILLAAAWDLFTFITPIQGAKLGLSASSIGFILGVFSVATFAIRLAMPWLARHYSEWRILFAALICASLCYAFFPFAHSAFSLSLIAAFLGMALGSSQPNVLALLHHTAPAGRGAEAIAIRASISNASQVSLPLLFGATGAAVGLFAVFWGMSVLVASGLPSVWHRISGKSPT